MVQNNEVIGIVPNLKRSKMLGMLSDSFTLVVTESDSIFAKITNDVLKQVVNESRAQAKAEGKGFLGQWGSQMTGFSKYAERYARMDARAVLAEDKANFAIPNAGIRSIKIKKTGSSGEDGVQITWAVTIQSDSGKLKFKTDFDPEGHFQKLFGDRVK